MKHKKTYRWSFLVLTFIGVCLLGRLAHAQEALPNIIYILSDDQAWTDYSFMGHPHIQTPNIDRLARESLTFTRGYDTAPLCGPSLASIITGLYPNQHKMTGNDPAFASDNQRYSKAWMLERSRLYRDFLTEFQKHPTVPQLLKKKGYVSHQSGKWWGGHFSEGGFDEGMTHGDPLRGGRHGDEGLTIGRAGMDPIFEFIDRVAGEEEPFFLWYAPFLPHTPHNPPDDLLQKYLPLAPTEAIARYWAMCEWFDQTIGELVNKLEEKGLTENTLIVYVCDNGWIQDPDVPNKYMPGSKQDPQDGGIRTPIMFKWPAKIQPKMDTTTLVSSIDIAVTSLAAAGLPAQADMKGVNVLDEKQLKKREKVFSLDFSHDMVDAKHPEKSLESRIIITNPWKLIVPALDKEQDLQLYNVYKDPFEKDNLASSNPKIVKKLKKELDKFWNPTLK